MSGCDSIDIHGIGKIQDFGYLVSMERDSMIINHISSNICKLSFCSLTSPLDGIIGTSIKTIFPETVSNHMDSMIDKHETNMESYDGESFPVDLYLNIDDKTYSFSMYEYENLCVFSIYEDTPGRTHIDNLYVEYIRAIRSMMSSDNQHQLFGDICKTITDLVDYDRAMVYMFSEDLSGKVVYEWINPSIMGEVDPYMGMCFPESDIPLPARQMYLLKPIRVIRDVHSDPVSVLGTSRLNLSMCVSRSSHEVHIAYMKNMGIRSSLSLGIIIGSELWGIISFHSYKDVHTLSSSTTRLIESLCVPFSMTLQGFIDGDTLCRERSLSGVTEKLFDYEDMSAYISNNHQELLTITKTDTIMISTSDYQNSWGRETDICLEDDADKLRKKASRNGFYTGMLRNPNRGISIILHGKTAIGFYRLGTYNEVIWGGDPHHVKIQRPDGVPGPRGSFERYLVQNKSVVLLWTEKEKELMKNMSRRVHVFLEAKSRLQYLVIPLENEGKGDDMIYNTVEHMKLDSSLLTHISHELFTPLNGIYNSMTLVSENSEMDRYEVETLMGEGLHCVESMRNSINGVLAITDGEDDIGDSDMNKYDTVEKITEGILSEYTSKAEEVDITFTCQKYTLPENNDLKGIHTSVVTNSIIATIDNSLRFTEKGGSITFSVSCNHTHREAVIHWKETASGFKNKNMANVDNVDIHDNDYSSWYTFTVRDTGCGIHRDMIDNVLSIVKPSSGISHGDISNSHQGVGIGMYKAMMDILKLDGTVCVASTVGEGMISSFIIPKRGVTEEVIDTIGKFGADPGGVIFIVDDSTLNRKMTSRLLKVACKKSFGFEPRLQEFADGRLCMEEVIRMQQVGEKPLCIIMDYHMPVMSGKEATEKIRKFEEETGTDKIPIVGYTADVTDKTRGQLMLSGMNQVIPKPISLNELTEMCQRVYGGSV